MRALILAATLAAASTPAAFAQPYGAPSEAAGADVSVAIGPAFAEKARRIGIDERDFGELRKDLTDLVRGALRKVGPNGPVRADLVITDAVPNRPTFSQFGRETSLSARSVGVGGAAIGGTVAFADGRIVPVSFRWYESDIRQEIAASTWYDADRAFEYFAGNLRRGDLGSRGSGSTSSNAGDFAHRGPS